MSIRNLAQGIVNLKQSIKALESFDERAERLNERVLRVVEQYGIPMLFEANAEALEFCAELAYDVAGVVVSLAGVYSAQAEISRELGKCVSIVELQEELTAKNEELIDELDEFDDAAEAAAE